MGPSRQRTPLRMTSFFLLAGWGMSGDAVHPLPFHLTSGIIRVCLDLTGLFRNKDIRPVLMIRLARRGARKQPHYRIVVIEKERARNGRPVEVVGTYNPRTNPASVEMKRDRVEYWVSKGAQMSDRVNKLFSKTPAPAAAGSAA
jgi:small subunit ribosomal protein S16